MSLLLENALDVFDPENAVLLSAADFTAEAVLDEPVALSVVEGYADHHDELAVPDHDAVRLPLHGAESAELTGEYVLYRDHDLRGPLFGVEGGDASVRAGDTDAGADDTDAGAGDATDGVEWITADDLARSATAARLRFWHPDHVPDEMPSYHVSPVDAVEPARNPLPGADAFLDGLEEFVAAEREAERRENRERARGTTPERRYREDRSAVPALGCLGSEDGLFVFRVRDAPAVGFSVDGDADRRGFLRDRFGVHEGDEVLLFPPDSVDLDDFPVRAEVVSTRGTELRLAVSWDDVDERTAVSGLLNRPRDGYGLSPLLNPVTYDRQTDAIDGLRGTDLAAVLAGERPLTFEDDAKAASEPLDDALNQDQRLAVEHALMADRLFCVHGPPGTGKTRTLVEFVRRSVAAGRDVLVCADSNQAVDNLLVGSSTPEEADPGSLHAHGQHGAGEFTVHRANARRSRNDVVRAAYGDGNAGTADVVAATNNSAARLATRFDVLVLDEATQATCASSGVPLARADKVVLAGDHQQLPPYSASDGPADSRFGGSLFEHVYADGGVYEGVGVQLRTQYRMHRDVAYLPNRLFYDKSLRNGRTVPELPDTEPILAHSFGGREERVEHSWRNPTEARFVELFVRRLLDGGLAPDDVGVISPYAAQVDLVKRRLSNLDGGDRVAVDTIDAFQGSEREAVVITFVRSNDRGDVGFLGRAEDGLRRLNVAMTRAKRHCSLVGDWDTLRGHRVDDPPQDCVETYRELYRDLAHSGRVRRPDPALIPDQ